MRRLLTLVPLLALVAACDERLNGTFGVTPAATQLAFTAPPSNVQAGLPISPLVRVAVQNATGQTVSNSNATVTMTITPGTGTTGAALNGATSTQAINGVASFNDLRISLAGVGYRLTASAQGLTPATSLQFDVTP